MGCPKCSAAALGSPTAVRVDEWDAYMDWVELHNPTEPQPVDLGACWLTDDPSEGGRRKSQLPPFTLIAPSEFAVFKADSATPGPGLFSFDLDLDGEISASARTTVPPRRSMPSPMRGTSIW